MTSQLTPHTPRWFSCSYTVCFGDTDAYGVVYYAQYLYFLEAARLRFLEAIQCPHHTICEKYQIGLVVSDVALHYKSPLKVEDKFTVFLSIEDIKSASLVIRHRVEKEGVLCNDGTVTLVSLDLKTFHPKRLPASLLQAFQSYCGI